MLQAPSQKCKTPTPSIWDWPRHPRDPSGHTQGTTPEEWAELLWESASLFPFPAGMGHTETEGQDCARTRVGPPSCFWKGRSWARGGVRDAAPSTPRCTHPLAAAGTGQSDSHLNLTGEPGTARGRSPGAQDRAAAEGSQLSGSSLLHLSSDSPRHTRA